MQGTLWQNHFDYARIAWKKMLKDSKNEFAYDDVLAKFDIWGGGKGGELVYHRSNDKIMWHIRTPKVGLINHA